MSWLSFVSWLSLLSFAAAAAPPLDHDIYVPDDPLQASFVLSLESNENLVRIPRSVHVFTAMLSRPGLESQYRVEALEGLAKLRSSQPLRELIREIERIDSSQEAGVLPELGPLLRRFSRHQFAEDRETLAGLTRTGQHRAARQIGWAGVVLGDGAIEPAWETASQGDDSLADLLAAIPWMATRELSEPIFARLAGVVETSKNGSLGAAAITAAAQLPGMGARAAQLATDVLLANRHQGAPASLPDRQESDGDRTDFDGADIDAACILALAALPADQWTAEHARPLAERLIDWLAAQPLERRNQPAARAASRIVGGLADVVSGQAGSTLRERIAALAVPSLALRALPHQMAYDKKELVVQAGGPVEIHFQNDDIQPHNLVISQPGSMISVGEAAEAMATTPEAAVAGYIPELPEILLRSRLLAPGESETISFRAPQEAGIYPYLCTYPGHWRRMFGKLIVLDQLAEYHRDPVAYLAAHPLSLLDEMLAERKIVEHYTFARLEPLLARVGEKRSFDEGRRLFVSAGCSACHRLTGDGGQVGPDLSDAGSRLEPGVILEDIVDPSRRIHEKFRTWMVTTLDGRRHVGILRYEDETQLELVRDPAVSCEPIVVPKEEIDPDESGPLETSTMPSGLLDHLTEGQILDLWTYVLAGGRSEDPRFGDR